MTSNALVFFEVSMFFLLDRTLTLILEKIGSHPGSTDTRIFRKEDSRKATTRND